MYQLEFLPIARKDMIDIVRYLSVGLQNPQSANNLADELIQATERLREFPYSAPVYQPIRPLAHEYRKLSVQNYLIFYWVDDRQQLITIARIVYAKRDLAQLFS